MLGRMVERFRVVRIGARFEQRQGKRGIVVEAGRGVQAREGIVGQILGNERGVAIGARAQKDARRLGQIACPARHSVGKTGEADVEKRLEVLRAAAAGRERRRLRHRALYALPVPQHQGHIESSAGDLRMGG